MTAPYYEADGIRLYLGDCREVTEWLEADVLITDPPYGINDRGGESFNAAGNRYTLKAEGEQGFYINGDKDTETRDNALALWGPKRPAIVFGSPKIGPPPGVRQALVWHKPPDSGLYGTVAGFRRDWEAIYLLGDLPKREGHASGVLRTQKRWAATGHRHSKPVALMETLCMVVPDGVIADPFAGAGSTLLAARNQGRQAIGVEMEEMFAEVAAKRLSQLAMVAPTPMESADPGTQEALL